ncbi:MAG: hypothetical protein M3680_33600 [Myxococcota bacterium]|nr:hypothetical protein [Myxococcota bacterium]
MPSPRLARAALAALVLAPLIAAAAGSPPDVSGVYTSNWDEVRLTQDGDRVRGTYVCCGGGTIEGRIIEGRTLRYRWRQPGAAGLGVWTIDGGQLRGTWGAGTDDDDGGRWDLASAQRVAR